MAKSFSTARPAKVARYDNKTLIVSYNIAEVEKEDTKGFEFDTVLVSEVSKPAIVEALVREKYSISDELSIQRQRTSKKAEFNEYNAFAEAAKATAKAILAAE